MTGLFSLAKATPSSLHSKKRRERNRDDVFDRTPTNPPWDITPIGEDFTLLLYLTIYIIRNDKKLVSIIDSHRDNVYIFFQNHKDIGHCDQHQKYCSVKFQ